MSNDLTKKLAQIGATAVIETQDFIFRSYDTPLARRNNAMLERITKAIQAANISSRDLEEIKHGTG